MAGYCGPQSTGGQLLCGEKEIELFGDVRPVQAEIGQLIGMSGHGDCDELCQFISCIDANKVKNVFLVHGEYKVQQEFATKLQRKGFEHITIPAQHEQFECV
jgi:metallo-beta-lactamase family protein